MNKAIILLLSFTLIIASCGNNDTPEQKRAKEVAKLEKEKKELDKQIKELQQAGVPKDSVRKIAVRIQKMDLSEFYTKLELQGRVDAGNSVNATPEAPGVVQKIYVSNGQFVRRGQTLATLKVETVQSGLDELNTQISFAKTLFDKQKRLWAQEIGTEIQLLSAKNNYEALIKKKNTISSQKRMYSIKAPISGVIDDVNIHVGDMSSPGMPNQIRIVNTSALKVEVDVPESYAGAVQSGSTALVIIPDAEDTLATNVKYVQKTIDPVKRTFKAELNPGSMRGLRPNMIARVQIATYYSPRAFVLPARVIQKINGGDYVFVADKTGTAKLKKVKLGKNYQGDVEIMDGLLLDEQVIVAGYEDVNEGDKLSITK
jgi:membrane fusion protein, multidrug efflux system